MATLGITMGCPVGIGPEILIKYYHSTAGSGTDLPVVIGDLEVLCQTAKTMGIPLHCKSWRPCQTTEPGSMPVLQVSHLEFDKLSWGKPNLQTGRAMAQYIEQGVQLTRQNVFSGIVTCPITKTALQQSGYDFPGHTEMLAQLTESSNYAMMMAGRKLRVVLATIHCRYQDVAAKLNQQMLVNLLQLTAASLKEDFGLLEPRIGVAGLNPHGGEGGVFGREEIEIISPAVERAQDAGIHVQGPYPPDTVFYKASNGHFDAVLAMYHDQGLIPFKMLHFQDGVNVTIGLPIVRTSVDHGTAYDIAGKGIADPTSLNEAVKLARVIVSNRQMR